MYQTRREQVLAQMSDKSIAIIYSDFPVNPEPGRPFSHHLPADCADGFYLSIKTLSLPMKKLPIMQLKLLKQLPSNCPYPKLNQPPKSFFL